MSNLDKNSLPSPAYMRIRQYVMGMIIESDGEARKIMSLSEIRDIFNVSVTTARKALKRLVDEGMLITRRGMGTFVNPNHLGGEARNVRYIGILDGTGMSVNHGHEQMRILSECLSQLAHRHCCARLITLAGETPEQVKVEIGLHHLDGLLWSNVPKKFLPVTRSLREKKFPLMAIMLKKKNVAEITDSDCVGRLWNTGTLVAEHLLARGHRKVIFIGGRNDPSLADFKRVFSKHGLKHDDELNIHRMRQIPNELQRKLENSGATAVFSHGDPVGQRALKFIGDYKTSRCVSQRVVSFERLVPQFPGLINDVIKLPFETIAKTAVNGLFERVNGNWGKNIAENFSLRVVEAEIKQSG